MFYDKSRSIGRRYSRQDEIGIPYYIAVDGNSLENKTVTIRDCDSAKQIRVNIGDLARILKDLLNDKISFENVGKSVDTRIK